MTTTDDPRPAARETMKPSEALRKARQLITPEGAWTKREYARDALDQSISPQDAGAVSYCAYGALQCVERTEDNISDAAKYLRKASDGDPISRNDHGTHADVLAAFDRAVELAEAEGC